MTDLEKFKKLYKSVGIPLTEELIRNEYWLQLKANDNEKLDGYSGFYTRIYFDLNGKFITQYFGE